MIDLVNGCKSNEWAKNHNLSKDVVRHSWHRGYSYLSHGPTSGPLAQRYKAMLARCYCKTHKRYPLYGGRGITVCARWFYSFNHFAEDMGPPPFPGASIDRKNNNQGYSPENCRWANQTTQVRNSRHVTDSASGVLGVQKTTAGKPWMAISPETGQYLGRFNTIEEATQKVEQQMAIDKKRGLNA